MLSRLAEVDICDRECCNAVISELWKLPRGAWGDKEYLFLSRLLLEQSCITWANSVDTSVPQVSCLVHDPICKELAYRALSLLLRHGYLKSFLGTLRTSCTPHRHAVLTLLCTFPCIQEHVVAPMIMEAWTTDRTKTLRAVILLGYNARRYATKQILELLDANTSRGRTASHGQQDLLATALIRLFAFSRICSIIEDEKGEIADNSFRIACLQALARDIQTSILSCNVCATSESPYSFHCPYNCKIVVSDTADHTYAVKDDVIILSYEELCLYLELLHEKLAAYEDAIWRGSHLSASHSPKQSPRVSSSRNRRASRLSRASSLHLGDLDTTDHATNLSTNQYREDQLDQSDAPLASSFCQLRTLHDKTCLLLLTSLKSSIRSPNEGVVSCAIAAMTKVLCSLTEPSLVASAHIYKRLQSVRAIQFIECVLDVLSHPSDSVKEVAVISLGSILVKYLQYVHGTVTMGLFYSILNLSITNSQPKVRNFCLLTIKYIYSNIQISPQDLLLKPIDVQQFVALFSSSSSSKLLAAECICLTNKEGRHFLMQAAQHDINTRNRVLCINALKCFAISVVDKHELLDLKHCLASLLVDSSTLVQASALDLYGYLYFLVTKGLSEELTQTMPELSYVDKQRLAVFVATPIITTKSFSNVIGEKLKDTRFCLNSDLFSSLLKVLQDYTDPDTTCTLLVDAILAHKKREKVMLSLLDVFSVYQPSNIRYYIILYRDVLEVQVYKIFDKRFPYQSAEITEYAVNLLRSDNELISIVATLSKRRSGSQIFADWCRKVLQLMEED